MEYQNTSAWDPHATISTYLTLDDIAKASKEDYDTAILKLVADSKEKGYKRLCIPLTTEKWKKRWSEMCLLPAENAPGSKEASALAAEAWRLNPGFQRDEVTITRLGM